MLRKNSQETNETVLQTYLVPWVRSPLDLLASSLAYHCRTVLPTSAVSCLPRCWPSGLKLQHGRSPTVPEQSPSITAACLWPDPVAGAEGSAWEQGEQGQCLHLPAGICSSRTSSTRGASFINSISQCCCFFPSIRLSSHFWPVARSSPA